MARRITIIQGHPDASTGHYCHALAAAYEAGAIAGGHEARTIDVATLDFEILRCKNDYERGAPPDSIRAAQEAITWAGHLVFVFPLWAGMPPALLKAFLEQTFRPGFAFTSGTSGRPRRLLTPRTARIVVTMGMPALAYRWLFGAHGVKALRSSLWISGIAPARATLIGNVEARDAAARARWLTRMRGLGLAAR